jgi:hypothetical protein
MNLDAIVFVALSVSVLLLAFKVWHMSEEIIFLKFAIFCLKKNQENENDSSGDDYEKDI